MEGITMPPWLCSPSGGNADTNSALEYILSPVRPDEFLEHYWARRPLHISGVHDKFDALLPGGMDEVFSRLLKN